MPHLEVYLFGSPRVERDGKILEADTRKATAMLAYLAITGEGHNRDTLAALLWPDADQRRARAALRRTLSALKAMLGNTFLETTRESITLKPSAGMWVDVEQFQRHLAACLTHGHASGQVCQFCLPELSAAVTLYRGDFLAGFSLRDSLSFDDWQFFQSEQLRRDMVGALERLVLGHASQGEFQTAIEYAHRWLSLDALHEPAYRQLMQLYAWSGRRDAALRHYRDCVRILDKELGVSPLEETVQLSKAIKENRVPPLPQNALVAPHHREQTPLAGIEASEKGGANSPVNDLQTPISLTLLPLVGRSKEWQTLLQLYGAIKTDGHFIAITGEAGIGKTRLAEEFLAHAQGQGAVIITAHCYEGETSLSYGPFVEGLRSALNLPTRAGWLAKLPPICLAETARLVPEILEQRPDLPAAPPLEGPGAQSRFFEAIACFLLELCDGPFPGVLFFDDLQWADSASLDLLTYLVRRLHGRPLYILGSWRSEENEAIPRLRQLVREGQRAGIATLISLSRLEQADVHELLTTLPGDLPRQLEERLFAESEGLPFFLSEYLPVILKDGSLVHQKDWSMPGGVRNLLRSRLDEVSETGWQLLTAAAVIGRSFAFDTLREASGRGEDETITGLEGLLSQGLIREIGELGDEAELYYDFSHEKLRALVYSETNLARRRLLHRRVATALVNHARLRREAGWLAGQIAHHFQLAGEESEAAHYFKIAGEHTRALYANVDALSHFTKALALGHPEPAKLHEAIGDLQTLLGEYSAALGSYETAAAFSDPGDLASLEHKLGSVYHRRGDWELAQQHFQAALKALAPEAGPHRAAIYADWSLTAHQRGEHHQAGELARQALELAKAQGDERALAQAHNILGILTREQGELGQARQHLESSLALAEKVEDPGAQVAALNNLALLYSRQNKIESAIPLVEAALSLCVVQGDRHREAALHSNLADLYHAGGQTEASLEHLKQSVAIYAEIGEQGGEWQPEIWKLVEW